MDTNKVVEMMDAIFEGKPYKIVVNSADDNFEDMDIRFRSNSVTFVEHGGKFVCVIDDSRMAREIAGALVTWANKRDGRSYVGNEAHAGMTLFGWSEIKNRNHPVNGSRAKWYSESVRIMSDETILRNISDMEKIAKHYAEEVVRGDSSNYDELQDIRRALDICHVELRKRKEMRAERVSGPPIVRPNDNV